MNELAGRSEAFVRRLLSLIILIVLTGVGGVCAAQTSGHDWTQFGWDASSSGASTEPTGITADNVANMSKRQVKLDGTVDASAIYLHGVTVKGAKHNVFFVTTTYGKTIAIDADSGDVLWEYTPPKYSSWAGSRQITNSTPVADSNRQYVYAASPDGTVEKLAVSDGHEVWSTPITLLPRREKIASPLHAFKGHIIAVTAGYIGDRPPYQGHVAILDPGSGKLLHVWNSLCSNRTGLIEPSSCASTQSAIWGRAGAVIDPANGHIFVATGNGQYNGKTDWGDSIIELNADATQMAGNYTPSDNTKLNDEDLDLGSTSPVLLGDGLLAQGGKDGLIRVLSLQEIAGTTAHQDHELQKVSTPSGAMLFTAPVVWKHEGKTWLIAADGHATAAWTLENQKLVQKWKNGNGGTSPIVAGGLLYVYDPHGGLRVYEPATGKQIADLDCGSGHWNSPIVVDGKIALPEGNANHHATSGVLDIWSLPAKH
ncbi:MAG: PQQ-binding-like beta-propeller repeat protein [Acidobacteriaceae bacterium]